MRDVWTKTREEWDLDVLDALQDAADSIRIIGTNEIAHAAGRVIGYVPLVLEAEVFGEELEKVLRGLSASLGQFNDAVRAYFGKPPAEHMAVPIIERPRWSRRPPQDN